MGTRKMQENAGNFSLKSCGHPVLAVMGNEMLNSLIHIFVSSASLTTSNC